MTGLVNCYGITGTCYTIGEMLVWVLALAVAGGIVSWLLDRRRK